MGSNINNKKITKNMIALYMRMGISMIISFYTTRVILEILGAEDYGLNNLVAGIVSMFSFLNASMGTAVQRFYSIEIGKNNIERLKKVFGTGLYLHVWVAVITTIIAELFAVLFLSNLEIPNSRMYAAHVVFQMSIISMALNILSVPYTALLRAREKFSYIAIIEIIQSFLRLGVLFALYYINYDKLITLSIFNFLITIYFLGTQVVFARKYIEAKGGIVRDKQLIKEMLSFISMLLFTVLALYGRDQGIVVLINIFFGLTINAAYAITMQVINIANTFVGNFKQALIPQIMSTYGSGDHKSMEKLMFFGTRTTFILMLMITLPLIFEGEFLLNLWLESPPPYTKELIILAAIYINVSSFTYFLYQGVHATGNIVKQQSIISLFYLLNIALVYIFFHLGFNFYTGLWVNIFIALLKSIFDIYYINKCIEFNLYYFLRKITIQCLILSIIVCGLGYIINIICGVGLFRFIFSSITLILATATLGFIILFTDDEKKKLYHIIKTAFVKRNIYVKK